MRLIIAQAKKNRALSRVAARGRSFLVDGLGLQVRQAMQSILFTIIFTDHENPEGFWCSSRRILVDTSLVLLTSDVFGSLVHLGCSIWFLYAPFLCSLQLRDLALR